tara:strand:- start:532 stop:1485 length:954 start_codon:yes stop_codon:yes gene_type:complete
LKRNKKNIFITGVNGFIGKNLCNYLTKKNYNVYGIDNFYSSDPEDLKKINSKYLYFKKKSILEDDIFKDAPFSIDVVFHLAAQTSVSKSISNPKENNVLNIDGFKNILDLSIKNNVSKFFFASSCAVYGDTNNLPCKESQKNLYPNSPYAESKLFNEYYSEKFASKKINIIGLRLFNIYGPMQNRKSQYAAVISKWLYLMNKNKRLIIYGDGNSKRDFCHVDDLCILFEKIIHKKNISGIFNFCTGKPCSINELYSIFYSIVSKNRKFKMEISPLYKTKREGEIKLSYGDNSFLKSNLNFRPKIKLREGIKGLINAL